LGPRSVIDIGCGTGALIEALQGKGCSLVGIDNAEAALEFCRARGPTQRFDLENRAILADSGWDAVVSLEVAEHLSERCADAFVATLTRLSS
jgi:2-polyprenyl-3-methyl-5-hydroxy-6-metoxy-1,4-benzoquinol methylase